MPHLTTYLLATLPLLSLTTASLSNAGGAHYLPNEDTHLSLRRATEHSKHLARVARAHEREAQLVKRESSERRERKKKRGSCPAASATAATTTAAAVSSATSSGTVGSSTSSTANTTTTGDLAALKTAGITQFLTDNGPAIGSWYRTDNTEDDTNGHSWCGFPYDDNTDGFAPDVSLMLANFDNDYTTAATAYCGLEAIVTGNNGVTKTMYIVDGFDHEWVREVGSIDIIVNSFTDLYGSDPNGDKDLVIDAVKWELTGNRNTQYSFKGTGGDLASRSNTKTKKRSVQQQQPNRVKDVASQKRRVNLASDRL